jgi:predicted acetyltransferase
MTFEYRTITGDELATWRRVVRRGFNEHVSPEAIESLRVNRIELDRAWAAFDGDEIVGTGGAETHTITVPGGAQVPVAGIAYVTTAATHRRRGVLTGMMRKLLEQSAERGEPILGLKASESAIYGRFGYGIATQAEFWKIRAGHGAIAHSIETPGRVRFASDAEAIPLMRRVYDVMQPGRVGAMDRREGLWRYNFFDPAKLEGKPSGRFFAVYENGGVPEGYAAYKTSHPEQLDSDQIDVFVEEMVTATDAAHAMLWKFLLNIDLLRELSVGRRAPDDALWWMLANPRKLRRISYDDLHVRVIDPVKALSARSYAWDGRLTLEVADSFWPDAAGTFAIEASGGSARCHRATGPADIAMTASELGAVYMGGASFAGLARAGRIEERSPGSLRLADMMFRTSPLPWTCHSF